MSGLGDLPSDLDCGVRLAWPILPYLDNEDQVAWLITYRPTFDLLELAAHHVFSRASGNGTPAAVKTATTQEAAATPSAPALPAALTALIDQKAEKAAKKKDALSEAVARFNDVKEKLGGLEQAEAFFEIHGADSLEPDEEDERIKPKDIELDSQIKDYSDRRLGLPDRPDGFGASHVQDPAWDIEEPSEVDIASTLKTKDWQQLLNTTKMLHGYVLKPRSGLSRARFPAFQLKPPRPMPGQVPVDTSQVKPEFEVFDASSISIKETKTPMEKSMAQNGFSSHAISASVGASTPYGGGSVSASYSSESQESKSSADLEDRLEYTATYDFPRARVSLDELNLEVTAKCAEYLVNIQKAANRIQ
ncbi:hypothetical protein CBER1_09156 [Cercospora berteroae]|uniref:Uncharacterized protein n=1 Tax=Cercospora berteroae TaxID=357750 RepID=A0A2S6BVG8_9PEZI|nr:hypothetical protein CBER1_09156 [Cercospora berteroae]